MLATSFLQVVTAQELQLRNAQLILAGAAPLDLGDYAIPCVADWNSDGRKDLIVGYRYADKIALYLNADSDASPAFTNYANLQAGGVDILHPSSGCGAPAPFVCDYDNDGRRDLLVGEGANGYVYFYHNTNTHAAPILAPGQRLTVDANPLSVGSRATPCLYDWDGDQFNDLLCGDGLGYVSFFKNIGTAQVPAYAAPVRIQAGGTDLNLGSRSVPRMFDWDCDGRIDLVGSSASGVYWCRNTSANSSPGLLAPVALRAPVSGSGLVPINTGTRMRLDLVDWDNDGAIDLLIGSADGTISCYRSYRFAFTALTIQPAGQLVCHWNSAPFLNFHILAGSLSSAITNRIAASVPSGGNATSWTNPVPFPSQFYRLQIAQ